MPDRIAIDDRWCTRPLGSTCNRCSVVCPEHAVILADGEPPRIDGELCTSCALCAGICDGIVCTDILPLDVLSHAISSAERDGNVHITCMEALSDSTGEPSGNVIVLTCLAELSPETWTALLAHRLPLAIGCDEQSCASCPQAGARGYALWDYALSKARDITGISPVFDPAIPQRESLFRDLHEQGDGGRRELVEGVGATLQDLASGQRRKRASTVVDDLIALQEHMHARAFDAPTNGGSDLTNALKLKSAYKSRIVPSSLELIKRAVLADPACAARIPITIAKLDEPACTCANHPCTLKCPTHALRVEFGKASVSYDPASCIGCGYCVAACPRGAIALEQATAELFLADGR